MKTNNRLFVDVHVLQTVPPSCVNRDDTGSPKTAVYGGVTRSRVSSQSWKKAIRDAFKFENVFPKDQLGNRTQDLVKIISERIRKVDPTIPKKDSDKLAKDTINLASKKTNKPIVPNKEKRNEAEEDSSKSEESAALFFITPKQVNELAELALHWRRESKQPSRDEVTKALLKNQGIDIALFGRMVAQAQDVGVDACAQVAHSISTHKVSNEYDYFTAVDDLPSEDNAGAAHIGTIEFNSSTLYRYATVTVCELYKQLKDDTVDAVCEFIRAFVYSMPTGKQNTFANRTLPYAVLVTLRTNQPVNVVGAFEKPVPPSDNGYETASAERLVAHVKNVYKDFAGEPARSLVTGNLLAELGEEMSFPDLLNELDIELRKHLQDCGDEQ